MSARGGIIPPCYRLVVMVWRATYSLSSSLLARSFSSNAVLPGVVGCLKKTAGLVCRPISFVGMRLSFRLSQLLAPSPNRSHISCGSRMYQLSPWVIGLAPPLVSNKTGSKTGRNFTPVLDLPLGNVSACGDSDVDVDECGGDFFPFYPYFASLHSI